MSGNLTACWELMLMLKLPCILADEVDADQGSELTSMAGSGIDVQD
jgi:hypothetical protein